MDELWMTGGFEKNYGWLKRSTNQSKREEEHHDKEQAHLLSFCFFPGTEMDFPVNVFILLLKQSNLIFIETKWFSSKCFHFVINFKKYNIFSMSLI